MHICERKRGAQSWGDILFLTGLYEVDTGWCRVVPGGTRLYKGRPQLKKKRFLSGIARVFEYLFVKATVTSRRVSNFFGNLLIKEMAIVLLSPCWARPDILPHQFDQ